MLYSYDNSPFRFLIRAEEIHYSEAHNYKHHQHERKTCAEVIVICRLKLCFDYIAYQNNLAAAELLSDIESGNAGHETMVIPLITPGRESGIITLRKICALDEPRS